MPARTGENLGRVLRLGAGDTVHIRAYKFNPIYARTERFDEYGKTAVLIATARRKFGRVLRCDSNDKHNVSTHEIKPISRQNPKPLKLSADIKWRNLTQESKFKRILRKGRTAEIWQMGNFMPRRPREYFD